MDRNEFLKKCQMVSMLKCGINGMPVDVSDDLIVECGNVQYYPAGYILTFKNGVPRHLGILHDLKANSVTECELDKIS